MRTLILIALCLAPIANAIDHGKNANASEAKQAVVNNCTDETIPAPIIVNECRQPNKPATDSEKDGGRNASVVGSLLRWSFRIVNDPTALFTALIFAVTLGLWIVAIRTARRQLRAYVTSLVENNPVRTNTGFEITMGIHNYGETPAYKVHGWSQFKAIPFDDWETYQFEKAPRKIGSAKFTAFPDRSYTHGTSAELTHEQFVAVRDGFSRLYLWGEIRYVDVFGRRKWSRFRVYFHVENSSGSWRYCEEGNEAK